MSIVFISFSIHLNAILSIVHCRFRSVNLTLVFLRRLFGTPQLTYACSKVVYYNELFEH